MKTIFGFLILMMGLHAFSQNTSLQSETKYDFVPGDEVLYFEDFSQDDVGDFPAFWSSNSNGEVKTINLAPGHWLHLNGEDATYCYSNKLPLPENFIIEFDIIPDADYSEGINFTLYEDESSREFSDDLFPGNRGLHIVIDDEKWESKGYNNDADSDWLTGQSATAPVRKEKINHVIIWIQKRRLRIYHDGKKAMDVATAIFQGTQFNRFRFSGWDMASWPFISNIKITTAAPDTRNKLLTEGKLISYGIYFDSGKDIVKPESFGALNDIALVLKENPDLKIRIVGHTDSDGQDQMNMDLSKRRADNVKRVLIADFGLQDSRIETEGAGESQPIAPNTTSQSKAKNRRVEFIRII